MNYGPGVKHVYELRSGGMHPQRAKQPWQRHPQCITEVDFFQHVVINYKGGYVARIIKDVCVAFAASGWRELGAEKLWEVPLHLCKINIGLKPGVQAVNFEIKPRHPELEIVILAVPVNGPFQRGLAIARPLGPISLRRLRGSAERSPNPFGGDEGGGTGLPELPGPPGDKSRGGPDPGVRAQVRPPLPGLRRGWAPLPSPSPPPSSLEAPAHLWAPRRPPTPPGPAGPGEAPAAAALPHRPPPGPWAKFRQFPACLPGRNP